MIVIDNTIVSEDILDKKFLCDLNACKGVCCVEGDSGAPLEEGETAILENIFDKVRPYMTGEGIKAVEEQGKYIVDQDGEDVTPLVEGKHCAYVFFQDGTAKCAIEKAYLEGKSDFKKPVSCHLYPIRVTRHKGYDAVNYHRWEICKPACSCGEKLGVKVYQFLEEPLIRKYGNPWYEELKQIDDTLRPEKKEF